MLMLFDYDGVIVDSFSPLLDLCIEAQGDLGCGRAPVARDFQTIESLTFDDLGRLIGIPEEKIAAYSARVFALQSRRWEVSPFSRIVPVFSQLATQHVIGVITASQGDTVMGTLQDFGLGSAISCVMGGELGTSKAARIAEAQALYSSSAEETFMTGDAISDIRAGKEAGVRTVAVSWGFQNRDLLADENPDFLIDAPDDLLSLAVAPHKER
jgi:phosphoglycolate phosphatase